MKNTNYFLITVILVAAVLVSGSMVYLGTQMTKTDNNGDADIQAQVEKGIEKYIQEQKAEAVKSQAAANQPTIVEGDFTDDDPFMGDEDAPVVLIEFSDYQCPFCRRFYNDTLPQIREKYIDTGKVKFVYRDFPLSFHANAIPYALAAECAREQGDDKTYFAYHDLIFDGQNKLGQGTVSVPEEEFSAYAEELDLNVKKFNECLDSQKYKEEVSKDMADGSRAGVRGTPGFLLNGRLISGAQPFAVFEQAIEEALNQ